MLLYGPWKLKKGTSFQLDSSKPLTSQCTFWISQHGVKDERKKAILELGSNFYDQKDFFGYAERRFTSIVLLTSFTYMRERHGCPKNIKMKLKRLQKLEKKRKTKTF